MQNAIIVQGLGFGDEGKGATVDFLCRELDAELVVRYCGGSQAGHNVVLPDGRRHVFSQFGAGTLSGAASFLGEQVIVDPPALAREAAHLRELAGADPFAKLTVHPRALVTTIYHQLLNQLRELARGERRHGSCGRGIGETRRYWLRYGGDAVFAADLQDRETLAGKLELLRQRSLLDLQEFVEAIPAEQQGAVAGFFEPAARLADELGAVGQRLNLASAAPACRTAIFEGAQGVLLDEWRGFHPFTTWSTVTLHEAMAIAQASGAERTITLGLTRGYATRHGAGPLPTWDPQLDAKLFDVGNRPNRWQGAMRAGWLDLLLLRYAFEAAGGAVDGLAVSCLDELPGDSLVCTAYRLADGATLHRLPLSAGASLAHQQRLAEILSTATPVYEPISAADLPARLAAEFRPIAIRSTSPTWQGRTLDAAWRSALTSWRLSRISTAPRPMPPGPTAQSAPARQRGNAERAVTNGEKRKALHASQTSGTLALRSCPQHGGEALGAGGDEAVADGVGLGVGQGGLPRAERQRK